MFVKTNSCAVPRTSLVSCESNIDTWLIAVNLSKKPMQEILSYLNFEKKERSEEGSSRSYNELIVQKEFKPPCLVTSKTFLFINLLSSPNPFGSP